ncbi:serine hydrolase [Streptomyces sp. NRRL F-2664]|uniref:serine hydrolase n=1 Tax=Streptomyces sp. NRRL F-2664 TaxID=1463842 RepID=UPI0004C4E0AD|nr:serine hydrolase [Streptomyces sp. NRRL F-2664]
MCINKKTSKLGIGAAAVVAVSLPAIAPAGAAALSHAPVVRLQTSAKAKVGSKYVECFSSDGKLAERLSRDIAKALKSRTSMASVALHDRATKTTCTFNAHQRQDSASVVKPIVLGALLLAKKGSLTQKEQTLARKMIKNSDNEATTALWRQLSDLRDPKRPDPVQIQNFLDAAGMKETVPDKEGSWGLTQVTATDLAKLLKLFTGTDNSVLSRQARIYALGLMRNVQDDQRWGTPAGAPEASTIQVKNGWLQRSPDGPDNPFDRGDWKVNSMGAFTGNHYNYDLVVLTQNNRVPANRAAHTGFIYGIDTIERVARAVHHGLHPDQSPAQGYEPLRPDANLRPLNG